MNTTTLDSTTTARRPRGGAGPRRRTELAAFLRSRRERITPEDVGMPPGPRRRTPGLRREEVAQLAGVGVTWYTWLEQGRPINASTQVLDAVARTLRLDGAEREHLYRLADVPDAAVEEGAPTLPMDMQAILDGLLPMPATVANGRCDVLAWNSAYAAMVPHVTTAGPCERNSMWMAFTLPPCCNPVVNFEETAPGLVAVFRHRYSRHLDEPGWKELVRRLQAVSPEFARLWASQDVALPGGAVKVFRHRAVGEIRTRTTSMDITASPGARLVVYTPTDDESRDRIGWLLANPEAAAPEHRH
ncbi:helix-turn-helix transcriptional regulator [Actinomadura madurae]|uniref:helix-turn-helix transcriptional regulator n=1 Tax=Actinomadura madurae TaxID=1993 RepID=UPI002025F6FE|nr:helix-turn-helix transcriptional regulator [Actinomadura madurae]MCP9947475.1 helix-turn-helix transcriptional regulator [Actinomadura madurae]MCP9976718.1 helix-turn-helix transcriptional regulator [Actinomadura madurae]MCQ0011788.1 helix-turn-helix transcriptional regulator [Actinomadura madurae]MCQ0012905.1 helix-turn-helix transcriptional regulator [Actinomadura madurae]URM93139.1 helix-turn-helix transcriptional regulator [Actinomadura madurae]